MNTCENLINNENQIKDENIKTDIPKYPSEEQIYTKNPNESNNINDQSNPLIEDYDAPIPQSGINMYNISDNNFILSDSDFNSIPHKNIYKYNNNTLYISTGLLCNNIVGLIFFIVGVGGISTVIFVEEWYGTFGFGVVFLALSICLMCTQIYRIYIIFGINDLTIIRRAFFRKSTKVYLPGELRSAFLTTEMPGKDYNHRYVLKIDTTNQGNQIGFANSTKYPLFTREEIDYFNLVVKSHIRQNMNNQ